MIDYIIMWVVIPAILFFKIKDFQEKKKKATVELNNSIKTIHARQKESQNRLDKLTTEMRLAILSIYDQDMLDAVNSEKIQEGMPSQLVVVSWGRPLHKSRELRSGRTIEKWYYGSHINRLGNEKYHQEVTLNDGIVVGWKDLV